MAKEKMNGSVDLLAKAMHKVFTEAVEGAVEPLTTEVKALRTEVRDVKEQVGTLKGSVQAQLAQHRKDVSDDVKAALVDKR